MPTDTDVQDPESSFVKPRAHRHSESAKISDYVKEYHLKEVEFLRKEHEMKMEILREQCNCAKMETKLKQQLLGKQMEVRAPEQQEDQLSFVTLQCFA